MQAVSRDEFETVKQLLASAARYAESANRQSEQNATQIAQNAEQINQNAAQINQLGKRIDSNAIQIDQLGKRIDEFVFQVNRIIAHQQQRIDRLDAMIDRYDGVLAYLIRKEQVDDHP